MATGIYSELNTIGQLVLASSSPRRQELVASLRLSLPVRILSTDADETADPSWSPSEIVEQLALRKAEAAYERLREEGGHGPSLIVGADTIVVLDGQVLGKPADEQDAAATLQRLQGREHEVYTGLCCLASENGARDVRHSRTRVWMKPMSNERIKRYVETGEPMDKAGSYGVQGIGSVFIERIEGDFYSVMGLSLNLLYEMLLRFKVDPFRA